MDELDRITLSCSTPGQLGNAYNRAIKQLSLEMKKRLAKILVNYRSRFGDEGAFERMNHRTIAQIFAEFDGVEVKPIASGEVGGVRYELHPPPPRFDKPPTS